ncbi:hypothetical protein [uncultured Pseudokineococcus sp.]|uniref:hypothetical protein n=1 Tax=uncultured Pseudokineococcus sp. TaxID=1642928 RepID=UPI00262ACA2B|nr:hypothetical protein [uncultured Pseudokineococcus sp.]
MDERGRPADGGADPDGAGVADPWGVPSVVHLRAAGTSVLLAADAPGAPRVLHWGGDLGDLSPDETEALALAAASPASGEVLPGSPLLPTGADPGDERGRDRGGDPAPGLLVVPGEDAAAPVLVRRSAALEVTSGGSQRLVVRSRDEALGVDADVELELGRTGVLRVRASAAVRRDGPVRLRGLHLSLPVPAVGRQVLVDIGGRLRPARSLVPTAAAAASTGRSGDAVVVQTAGRGPEELWAMASSAGRGAALGGPPTAPAVRAVRVPGRALALVGGTDASAEAGVLRWATPALVAVHGGSWPHVRRRLDAAVRPG